MRTLKKVLALTIALATLFSLTAFAAYKDESAIASETMSAVNLVNSLSIMTGDPKGNFNPTATITRAEAAKMVYVIRTFGKTNADGWKGQNAFTDVKGHWAEGFINYCQSVGIIAGVGNNKFNPEGKLTGVELAKMLLVAAAYKPDVQGYTGSAWQSKVLADAEAAGLFNNYAPAYVGAAPRQYAAVMFANALLRTKMAVYLAGDLYPKDMDELMGERYFGLKTETGVLSVTGSKTFSLAVPYFDGNGDPQTKTVNFKNFAMNKDLNYQSVTVVYNTDGNVVYDAYASGVSKVYNVNGSEIKLAQTTAKDINVKQVMTLELPGYEKTTYTAKIDNTNVAVVFVTTSGAAVTDEFAAVATAATGNNDVFRFIDADGDDKIDTVVQFDATYGIVVKNNTTDGLVINKNVATPADTVVASKTAYADVNFKDTVAVGNVIRYYADMAGTTVVEKAPTFIGKTTAESNGVYTIGGSKYELSAGKIVGTAVTVDNKEYKFVTDGKYIVAVQSATDAVVVNEFSKDIALLVAVKDGSTDTFNPQPAKVQVVLPTGETKIYEWGGTTAQYAEIKKNDAGAANGPDVDGWLTVPRVMQYTLKDGKITLVPVVDPDTTGGDAFAVAQSGKVTFTKSTNAFTFGGVAVRVVSDAYFFMQGKDAHTYIVVKASELKDDIKDASNIAAAGVAYTTKNGINTLAFGYIADKAPVSTTKTNSYAIVGGNAVIGTKWDVNAGTSGASVKTYTVMDMKGNDLELVVASGFTAIAQADFGLYEITTTNGESTLKKVVDLDDTYVVLGATLAGYDANSIMVGSAFVDFASDATTLYLDGATFKPVTDKTMANAKTVSYVMNDDDEITTLIVTAYK